MCEKEHEIHIIIPPGQAPEVLKHVGDIYLRNCLCRVKEENCPQDEWEVCILFGNATREDLSEARKISKSAAEDLLRTTSQRNAVYTLFMDEDSHQFTEICSCCTCCCGPINDKKQEGKYHEYLRSNYVAVTDDEKCIGCGSCEPLCPFDARWVEDGVLQFADERCFGCGRCISECPEDAITLEFQADRGMPIPQLEI